MKKLDLQSIPRQLTSLSKHLQQDLGEAEVYLVGGAVRDMLLKRATKDYDLVVRGVPLLKLEKWLADHGKVSLVGKTFGVFKWQPAGWAGEQIDVALPRTEHVIIGSGQYRDFKITMDHALPIEHDLLRRDFTINALALEFSTGKIIDPSNGQADLSKKTIRAVGEPVARFNEDLSRTLRGIRQACQLRFQIEPKTWEAMGQLAKKTCLGKIKNNWLVPREVVARELLKAFAASPLRALELFDEAGHLPLLLPEVTAMKRVPQPSEFHSEGDVFEHTKLALAALSSPEWKKFFGDAKPSLNTIVATLLHDIGKPLTLKTPQQHGTNRIRTDGHDVAGAKLVPEICSRLKLTSYTDATAGQVNVETIQWLVQHHMLIVHGGPEILKPSTIYRYFWKDQPSGLALQQLIFADSFSTKPQDGKDLTLTVVRLQKRISETSKQLVRGKLTLLMSGLDIIKAFDLKPGPKIGKLLEALEEAQLSGKVKTKSQARAFLKTKL